MRLSYRDFNSGERVEVEAQVTTDHPASSYGQPVIVLPEGDAADINSWLLLGCRIEAASAEEIELLKGVLILDPAIQRGYAGGDMSLREHLRKAGARTSEAKAQSSRANGHKGGRPRKKLTD